MSKMVYFFGGGKADGNESMKNLLGGKGANLAEMAGHKDLRLPVPPGFTITTEICAYYYQNKGKYPKRLKEDVEKNLAIPEIIARGYAEADVRRVVHLIRISEYKRRQSAVGMRITERSYGKDWRYPITARYQDQF